MFLATSNKARRLLCLSYIGHVRLEELTGNREEVMALLAELSPGFRILADFTHLETMDANCRTEIGKMMEVFDRANVGMLIRVMPDPNKDPGLNILTVFHYRKHPKVANCQSFAEGVKALSH